ncbi:MAG: hypothetical protein EXR52_04815 [Dehalococcoidia bacterium]|nr:hypothetical protein [Dehalococcoidia bacterium]
MLRALTLLLFGLAALLPGRATAHPGVCTDPALQLLSLGFSGAYVLSVSVNPAYPTVGTAQLVVGVCDGDTLTPVEGATVQLTPVSPDGKEGSVIRAFTRTQYAEEYSADVRIKDSGTWRYKVRVDGSEGRGEVEVQLNVLSAPAYDGGSTVVFAIANGAILVGAGYIVWQIRRGRTAHQDRPAKAR